MKFLADMGIALKVVGELINAGHDALHVRDCLSPTSEDEAILDFALREERIVLTMDHDFGDMIFYRGSRAPSVIFFRVNDEKPKSILQKLVIVLENEADALENGVIVTVEDTRIRVRPLPIKAKE